MTDETEEAPWDLLADALTSLDELDEPDVDPVLDVREGFAGGEGDDPFVKIPLERAQNLIKVRRTVQALLEARITKADFLNTVRPLERSLENGLRLVASAPVQKQIEQLPEEERVLFDDARHSIEMLHQGVRRMMLYADSDDLQDVKEGLSMVEESFRELDEVQDEAIEIGRAAD